MVYNNPTDYTQNPEQQPSEANNFQITNPIQPFDFGQQYDQNQGFFTQFSDWLGQQKTPQQIREEAENRYGYQDLQENYLRTKEMGEDVMSAARAVPENVTSRGASTLMTAAQRGKIVNKEVGELMDTYQSLGQLNEQQGRRLAIVEQNMNTYAKLEMAKIQQQMTPWLQKYNDKNIMQAREYSGWTFASQMELNTLLANQQAGLSWGNAQANRAHQLAMQENGFNHQLNLLEKQNEWAQHEDLWS